MHPKPSHRHSKTLGAQVLHWQMLIPLPMPSETAVVHPAQSMFSKGPQKLQSFCKTQNKSAQLQ